MPRQITNALMASVFLFCGASLAHADTSLKEGFASSWLAGRHAQFHGQWDQAAGFYDRALKVSPNNIELQIAALRVHVGQGDFARAELIAADLNENNHPTMLSSMVLASVAAQAGNFDAVLEQAELLEEGGINKIIHAIIKAWGYAGKGEGDLAIAALEPIDKINRLKSIYSIQKALIMDLLEMEGVEQAYDEAVGADYASTRSVLLAANHALRQGQVDKAKTYLDLLVEHGVENWAAKALLASKQDDYDFTIHQVPTARDGLAEGYYDLAGVMMGIGDNTISLLNAQLALELRPDLAGARLSVAQSLNNREDYIGALEQYLYIAPEMAKFYPKAVSVEKPRATVSSSKRYVYQTSLAAARTLENLEYKDAAIKLLTHYAESWPERSEGYSELGHMHRRDLNYEGAIKAYSKALEVIEHEIADDWVLYYARGIAYDQIGDWKNAEADFVHALELSPEEPYVLNYLGYSWIDRDLNLVEAQKMVETAVMAKPQDGHIVDSLGWVLYKLGDLTRAVKILERAVSLNPTDTVINDHLGDAYLKAGKPLQARYQWERAQMGLNDEHSEELREAINYKIETGRLPDDAE